MRIQTAFAILTLALGLTTLALVVHAVNLAEERDDYRRQATLAVRESLELKLQLNRAEQREGK
jgi:hypothetical protein